MPQDASTDIDEQLASARRELREVLEQQAATAEVLEVISRSPGQLEPVFQIILANAMRICQAKFGNLLLYDGDRFSAAAVYGAPPAFLQARARQPVIHLDSKVPLGRLEVHYAMGKVQSPRAEIPAWQNLQFSHSL